MKTLLPLCAMMLSACSVVAAPKAVDYVVAVDRETQAEPDWQAVVETLRVKHEAEVLTYDGKMNVAGLLPELQRIRPKYVCFVTKPENAGRALVVNIAQTLRKIDDDPYGDAIWGIITGYEAADAMRLAKTPHTRVVKRVANSEGRPEYLDDWESGFISDEKSPSNLWVKAEGQATELRATGGNIAKSLAEMFNTTPFNYFLTSGHATQRDWQIVYNKDVGSLRHDDEGNLFFLHTDGTKYPVKSTTPKVYLAAGNCLIGDIDQRSCMTTAWLHSGGLEQFVGYTCVTFYGFMGWGIRSQFEQVRCSFAEAHYLQNQLLLWTLAQKNPQLVTKPIAVEDFGNGRKVQTFVDAHKPDLADDDTLGLLWDRDIVAFYGDPAERVFCPGSHRTVRLTVKDKKVEVEFLKDMTFGSLTDVKNERPIMRLLSQPPAGTRLLTAKGGQPVPGAVVNDRFILIPVTGKHAAGEVLRYKLAN